MKLMDIINEIKEYDEGLSTEEILNTYSLVLYGEDIVGVEIYDNNVQPYTEDDQYGREEEQ